MPFDPDAYLNEKSAFDPDEYLGQKSGEFNPDAYLAEPGVVEEPGLAEQALEAISTPDKEFDEQTVKAAREYLKRTGYDSDTTFSTRTAAGEFLDNLMLGQADEARAWIESKFSDKSYDELRDMYEAAGQILRKENPGSAIAGAVTSYLVPGTAGAKALKLGTKGATRLGAAAGTAMGASVAAERAEEGRELEAAGKDVALGLGLGALGGLIGKGASKAKAGIKAKAEKIADSGFDSEQAERVMANFQKQKEFQDKAITSINQLSDKQAEEFQKVILDGMPIEEAAKYGDLDDALENYRDLLARRAAVAEEAGLDPKTANRAANFILDAQYVGDRIDRRWGTDFMRTMNELSDDFNKATHLAKGFKEAGKKVIEKYRPKNLEDSRRIIKEVEQGLNTPAANAYRQLFKEMADGVNAAAGTDVVKLRANYVPHYTKRSTEVVAILRKRVEDLLGKKPVNLSSEDLAKIEADQPLMDSLNYLSSLTVKKNDPNAIPNAIAELYTSSSLKLPETFEDLGASSIRARKAEDVPELLREYDLGRLIGGWADSVGQDVLMRKNVRKIKTQALALQDKDPEAYRYMQAYINDLGGIRQGLSGMSQRLTRNFSTAQFKKALDFEDEALRARNAGNRLKAAKASIKAKLARGAAEAPQFAQMIQSQMYPAFLGLRMDANLRNLTQPYVYTVQQVSRDPRYQAKLLGQNLFTTGYTAFKATKNQMDELKRLGLSPADPTPGAFVELQRGIASSGGPGRRLAGKALEKANNTAMYLYQQSDIANRIVTLNMAKTVTKDAIKGNKSALKYFERLPSSYRRPAMEALKAGDEEDLLKLAANHLNSTTQFNYNRASMSEYGRFMGSMFTMFSKWPTAIIGDIVNTVDADRLATAQRKAVMGGKTRQLANKYLGPYVALMATNAMLTGATDSQTADAILELEKEDSNLRDFFIPKYGGFTGSAPITSATGVLTDPERSMVPPALQGISEAFSGKFDTALGMLPGYVWARFVTERLPKLQDESGKKPVQVLKEDILELD